MAKTFDVNVDTIFAAEKFARLTLISQAVEALVSPDERRRGFFLHHRRATAHRALTIGELQQAKHFLASERERIERETVRYIKFTQMASDSVKFIFNGRLPPVRGTIYRPDLWKVY